MNDRNLDKLTQHGSVGCKKVYARPLLTIYGSVKSLTQSGVSKSNENAGVDSMRP